MVSISLCMIVKNEEDVLARCLDSAAELVDDFAAARNESFSHAVMDYCLWLDADDVLLEEDQEKFRALKEELDPGVSVVMAPYHTGFDGSGRVTFSYYRERLIKNRAGMSWVGAVHEVVPSIGNVLYGDFAVTHKKTRPSDPDRNLRIYQSQLEAGKELEPRQQFYYGRELYYHHRWEEALEVFEAFLEEGRGWVENNIDACCHCAYWYALALTCARDDRRGGFVSPDCYGYLPCIQLCVCYSRLGGLQRAEMFNELAALYKPDSPAVLHNRAAFQALSAQTA